jgi:hypothetical protein
MLHLEVIAPDNATGRDDPRRSFQDQPQAGLDGSRLQGKPPNSQLLIRYVYFSRCYTIALE